MSHKQQKINGFTTVYSLTHLQIGWLWPALAGGQSSNSLAEDSNCLGTAADHDPGSRGWPAHAEGQGELGFQSFHLCCTCLEVVA